MKTEDSTRLTELEEPGESKFWSRTMPLWIFNMTGYDLDYVGIIHYYSEAESEKWEYNFLGNAQFKIDSVHANSDFRDTWTVDIHARNEGTLVRIDYPCAIEYSDVEESGYMTVVFGPRLAGFSVVLPASSSCWGVRYANGIDVESPLRPRKS